MFRKSEFPLNPFLKECKFPFKNMDLHIFMLGKSNIFYKRTILSIPFYHLINRNKIIVIIIIIITQQLNNYFCIIHVI